MEKTMGVLSALVVFMPFAGLRYVYFHHVRSEGRHFDTKAMFQAYAHWIGRAFNAPAYDPNLEWNSHVLGAAHFGGRVGIESAPICRPQCFRVGLQVGYLPLPESAMVELHISN